MVVTDLWINYELLMDRVLDGPITDYTKLLKEYRAPNIINLRLRNVKQMLLIRKKMISRPQA